MSKWSVMSSSPHRAWPLRKPNLGRAGPYRAMPPQRAARQLAIKLPAQAAATCT
eukprot:CAMPEP_0170402530 /NCGR_PEP_ID=MMETSP0117_2-20130122/25611_1 /TAXON_ID=400756 /ORGANISM="Durinskia baltica, Strain CSIRO CS-38" /LENGTH=53 /DNA_ID=CAMNT_0010659413 /DNA_START=23 /DNA_END=181 /DNA_ORIENTATION=+